MAAFGMNQGGETEYEKWLRMMNAAPTGYFGNQPTGLAPLSRQSQIEVAGQMARAQDVIPPPQESFGIPPQPQAQAQGQPVPRAGIGINPYTNQVVQAQSPGTYPTDLARQGIVLPPVEQSDQFGIPRTPEQMQEEYQRRVAQMQNAPQSANGGAGGREQPLAQYNLDDSRAKAAEEYIALTNERTRLMDSGELKMGSHELGAFNDKVDSAMKVWLDSAIPRQGQPQQQAVPAQTAAPQTALSPEQEQAEVAKILQSHRDNPPQQVAPPPAFRQAPPEQSRFMGYDNTGQPLFQTQGQQQELVSYRATLANPNAPEDLKAMARAALGIGPDVAGSGVTTGVRRSEMTAPLRPVTTQEQMSYQQQVQAMRGTPDAAEAQAFTDRNAQAAAQQAYARQLAAIQRTPGITQQERRRRLEGATAAAERAGIRAEQRGERGRAEAREDRKLDLVERGQTLGARATQAEIGSREKMQALGIQAASDLEVNRFDNQMQMLDKQLGASKELAGLESKERRELFETNVAFQINVERARDQRERAQMAGAFAQQQAERISGLPAKERQKELGRLEEIMKTMYGNDNFTKYMKANFPSIWGD